MVGELEGKIALITEVSATVGETLARTFARAGAKVFVTDSQAERGKEIVSRIFKEGYELAFIKTDASVPSEINQTIDKILARYGKLDCAINNDCTVVMGALTNFSEEDWNQTIDINLKATWRWLKHEIPAMLRTGGGTIVNIASISANIGAKGLSIYAASKGGVVALTKAAAVEYAKSGIRINAVSPASIKTNLLDSLPAEVIAQMIANHPIGRQGMPEEVADTVLWLCSDKASFITGHNLLVDGGYTAQ